MIEKCKSIRPLRKISRGRGLGGLWGENGNLRGRSVEETLSILVREELAAEGLIGEGEKELEGLGDDARGGSEDIT